MPYQRVDPVSERAMLYSRYHGHHTICETLREIYLIAENEEIKMKCRIAMAMAKKMHNKLKQYREAGIKAAQGE